MLRSVGLYLTRFDEEPPPACELAAAITTVDEPLCLAEPEPAQPVSEDLRQALIEEGRAAAQAECNTLIERERVGFETRLQEERNNWAREEGNLLATQFRDAINDLVVSLETSVGQILEPFVIESVRKKMLKNLMAQLRSIVADHERPVVQLSGPMDLLEVICAELTAMDVSSVITEVGGIDAKARLDATLIETSIQEWIEHLRGGDDRHE